MTEVQIKEFYTSLENRFREGSLKWNSYFIHQYFDHFSIDFLREFRDKLDLIEVYVIYEKEGEVWILKQDKRKWKEFFGDSDYD